MDYCARVGKKKFEQLRQSQHPNGASFIARAEREGSLILDGGSRPHSGRRLLRIQVKAQSR
jgi:hypothetical protein